MEATEVDEQAPTGGGRRLSTITIDQAISSASNVLIAVLAARLLTAEDFGMFAIVLLTYISAVGVSRSMVSEPLLVHPDESRERPGAVIGSSLALGAAVGAVVAIGGQITSLASEDLGGALVLLGALLPFLILQDVARYLAFATHRPGRAVAIDTAWLLLLLVAVAALAITDTTSLSWFVGAWAGMGAISSSMLFWQHRGHRILLGFGWIRETWSYSWRYVSSFAVRQGSVLFASSVVGALLGAAALGAVNGSTILFGALVQLQAAAVNAGVSEISHLPNWSPRVHRHLRTISALTTIVAALNFAVLLAVPDRLGVMVLGDTWSGSRALLVPVGVQMLLVATHTGVRAALLGTRLVRLTMRIDMASAMVIVVSTVLGSWLLDLRGTMWLLAGGQAAVTALWWSTYWFQSRLSAGDPVASTANA